MGILLLQKGVVTGADVGGVQYDGTYRDAGSDVEFNATMTVPPGVMLAQGAPARPTAYTVPINITIPKSAIDTLQPVLLQLPPGPVNVIFRRLRSLSP
jgi:hypothetical protein